MNKVLILSPRFPPINAPDMHRVRHSLPYYHRTGWEPLVLAVDPDYVERGRDGLLLRTLPDSVNVRHVSALDPSRTRKVGLGNLALRSLPFYERAGSRIIQNEGIDLVYFSTTAFPLPVLGRYWKWRFGVPYVVDMQDPWHSKFYLNQPKEERPPKFWFAYRLGKYTEPVAMQGADAIVSVASGYCDTLQERYENITPEKCRVLPFGALRSDFAVVEEANLSNPFFETNSDRLNVVYAGAGGYIMKKSMTAIAQALKRGLADQPQLFEQLHLHLIGTSYAPAGQGQKTLEPIAEAHGVEAHVHEHPTRVPYFQALHLLREGDALLLPGSIDADYTASKLYPYILARKPLLAVFNEHSSVVDILRETQAGESVTFNADTPPGDLAERVYDAWRAMLRRLPYTPDTDWNAFQPYTAEAMTRKQVEVFDQVLDTTPLR
jgi:hypothetical protein